MHRAEALEERSAVKKQTCGELPLATALVPQSTQSDTCREVQAHQRIDVSLFAFEFKASEGKCRKSDLGSNESGPRCPSGFFQYANAVRPRADCATRAKTPSRRKKEHLGDMARSESLRPDCVDLLQDLKDART